VAGFWFQFDFKLDIKKAGARNLIWRAGWVFSGDLGVGARFTEVSSEVGGVLGPFRIFRTSTFTFTGLEALFNRARTGCTELMKAETVGV
jgi:hypothetical protein